MTVQSFSIPSNQKPLSLLLYSKAYTIRYYWNSNRPASREISQIGPISHLPRPPSAHKNPNPVSHSTPTIHNCLTTFQRCSAAENMLRHLAFLPSLPLRAPKTSFNTLRSPLHPRYTTTARRPRSIPAVMTVTQPVKKAEPKVKYLADYRPPDYYVTNTNLSFLLDDEGLDTIVRSRLTVRPACTPGTPLVLDGESLQLLSTPVINGFSIPDDKFVYDQTAGSLTIDGSLIPDTEFTFESAVRIRPAKNTELTGLYMSAGDYCTQCEAEGFRRITFYVDRPDVMAKFSVRVEADKVKHPVLLSNGNCVSKGEAEGGRHWAEFEDPFPKPCYLFALVAGDLACLQDTFTTVGGRNVNLKVFVKGESEVRKCEHAMQSLKRAMKWDEVVYGLEYNYDVFNIVAISSFVFGAMENTSLNIFNSKYVLVSPETATDTDFNSVEGVVAHEYFHNYSGNRVTVSSWFQLSLKEGLTVFRDQSFSQDMNSATVKRIRDVAILRSAQFAEDAGPMAHPIRPKSYITCNSFYTATVYNKGAEVIRMLKTIVGPEGFRKGTDIYFSRNDGKAVTCDDWVQAIQDANPHIDLTVFRQWYNQAGTPIVTVDVSHDEAASTMTITCEQTIPPVAKQPTSVPMLIPIKMGLIGPDGKPVPVDLGDGSAPTLTEVLNFETAKDTFVLHNVPKGTVPSLLREFSAPVKLERVGGVPTEELAFLMANDTDEFNRWECGQKLALKYILDNVKSGSAEFADVPDVIIDAFRKTLVNESIDAALRADVFVLPPESYIVEQMDVADPVRIRAARKHLRQQLAEKLEAHFTKVVNAGLADKGEYKLDPASQGKRVMTNVSLSYLAVLEKKETYELCLNIVRKGSNMTDVLAALGVLANCESEEREIALSEFYEKWKADYLVVDKWLSIQATSTREDVLENVKGLTEHEAYKETIPNSVYALIRAYGYSNVHIPTDGSGYKFLADQVIRLDPINAQVAARVARAFTRWRKYDVARQSQMEFELKRIKEMEGLSKDVFEVVNNCLT